MDCSPPGSSVHGISRARILEWVAIFFFRGSFQPRDWTYLSLAGGFFTTEPTGKPLSLLQYDRNVWWMRSCVYAILTLLKNASVISFPDVYLFSVNHCDNWCWSWNSNTLATWCEELTHWKIPWCWKDWKQQEKTMVGWHHQLEGHEFDQARRVGDGHWWWKPGALQSMGWQRVRQDWATKLNWNSYIGALMLQLNVDTGNTILWQALNLNRVCAQFPWRFLGNLIHEPG